MLTPHASAILLDPECGLPAAKARAKNAGLLLAYEESGYDNTQPGRLPDLLPHVSVKRIVDWGADAVKILIYYTPFDDAKVNDIKHAFIERIGAECETNEIPFFLEFVGYDPQGGDEKGLEFAKQQAGDRDQEHGGVLQAAVLRGRAESGSSDQRRVRRRHPASTRARKPTRAPKRWIISAKPPSVASKPFIYLSAGVSNAQFIESLHMAAEAGTDFSGVLCGRATWKEGIPVYAKQGVKALEDWLANGRREEHQRRQRRHQVR